MLKKSFRNLKKGEWVLLLISLAVVSIANVLSGGGVVTVLATVIGVVALIFIAKGDVTGQVLLIVFSFLYGIESFKMHYYGEMITYIGMSMPAAAAAVVSWLKNPYGEGKNEVKISRLTKGAKTAVCFLTGLVTWIFYYILKALGTSNLFFSTLSVATSFSASALVFLRSSYYAVFYMANDVVIIILWLLAAFEDFSYFPMTICFLMFLINDAYGFWCWKKREKEQMRLK